MFPWIEKGKQKLLYKCRSCAATQPATDSWRTWVKTKATDEGGHAVDLPINPDVVDDVALPRTREVRCDACGHHEAVFFTSPVRRGAGLRLVFVCTSCRHDWLQ